MALLVKVFSVARCLITLFVVGLVPFTGWLTHGPWPMGEGRSTRTVNFPFRDYNIIITLFCRKNKWKYRQMKPVLSLLYLKEPDSDKTINQHSTSRPSFYSQKLFSGLPTANSEHNRNFIPTFYPTVKYCCWQVDAEIFLWGFGFGSEIAALFCRFIIRREKSKKAHLLKASLHQNQTLPASWQAVKYRNSVILSVDLKSSWYSTMVLNWTCSTLVSTLILASKCPCSTRFKARRWHRHHIFNNSNRNRRPPLLLLHHWRMKFRKKNPLPQKVIA